MIRMRRGIVSRPFRWLAASAILCLIAVMAARQTMTAGAAGAAAWGIDARDFGFSAGASGSANKEALQRAADAAYRDKAAGSVVRVPIAATVDASVYLPPGLSLV